MIEAVGTINSIENISNGTLDVKWDLSPRLYKGPLPKGEGSGNWWRTLTHIKRRRDIDNIFYDENIEERLSRICWNTNGWLFPSGKEGKSDYKESHEYEHGYGHEEWLFNFDNMIDGYHYSFLEPILKEHQAFVGKKYDIKLYTINGKTKKRYWVGEIKNIEVISSEESQKIKEDYRKRGWLEEMENQIFREISKKGFSDYPGDKFFNIKFRSEDAVCFWPNIIEINPSSPVYQFHRYSFSRNDENIEPLKDITSFNFDPNSGTNDENMETTSFEREQRTVQLKKEHKLISIALKKFLLKQNKNVVREHPLGYGAAVDIVVDDSDGLVFYEIKTYASIKQCIREALGQILEYCYWPDKSLAKELIIVSPHQGNEEVRSYFKHLRHLLNLKIYYQQFNKDIGELTEKI